MKFVDYYRILGVAPEASADCIKTAYRKMARKHHPDVCKTAGTEKRFTDIGEAYEVLQDPKRRSAYDQLRAGGWREGQDMDAPPPSPPFRSDGDIDSDAASQFSDFFRAVFGDTPHGGGRRDSGRSAYHERGEDVHYIISISLEESYHGGERKFELRVPSLDPSPFSTRTITVRIPKGVVQGSKIRLRGQGHPGSSAELNGDLYLEVELAPHHLYRVDGHDLSLVLPIAPWEAVLGAQVDVPTIGGMVTVTIPAGAQDGQRLRLKGRGLPGDPPGDQHLTLRLVVPPVSNDKTKDLYRSLAKESAFDPRAHMESDHG
jgi:curved DNA-binding protein